MKRVLLLMVSLSACRDEGTPDRVPLGGWGGDHVGLEVGAEGATVEFDCAHGRIDAPLLLDAGGRFDVAGVFVREHGGPVREGEAEDSHPARYRGESDGRRLAFVVTLTDEGGSLGPYAALYRAPPRVVKCL